MIECTRRNPFLTTVCCKNPSFNYTALSETLLLLQCPVRNPVLLTTHCQKLCFIFQCTVRNPVLYSSALSETLFFFIVEHCKKPCFIFQCTVRNPFLLQYPTSCCPVATPPTLLGKDPEVHCTNVHYKIKA